MWKALPVCALATCIGVLWNRDTFARPDGICHFVASTLACQPQALCELQWDGAWSAKCARMPPKVPDHHPPIPSTSTATFCGMALDESGHIVIVNLREWGMARKRD